MRRIGIDLGTTNTCIYHANFGIGAAPEDFQLNDVKIYYRNKGDIINPPVENIMPSAIYGVRKPDTEKEEFEFYLGKIAEQMAKNDKIPEIINTKRLLCRENPTTKIAYELTAQDIAQKLLEGCYYSIQKELSPRQINQAHFCITQPAAFGLFASRSIQDAAVPAGFANAEAQREPIAALLSFLYEQLRNQDTAQTLFEKQKAHGNKLLTLVVDIGGGTTDVTIQEIEVSGKEEPEQGCRFCTGYKINFLNMVKEGEDGEIPVATANQEPAFGGFDFDKKISAYVIKEWSDQYFKATQKEYNWNSAYGKLEIAWLYQRIQNYKNSLSFNPQDYDDTIILDGQQVTCHLTPELVYELTEDLCESPSGKEENSKTVYGIIADTIRRSGYHTDDIDYFFVTGGMSSFKPIRDLISRRFSALKNRGSLYFSSEPLYDIARGAAVCNCFFAVDMPQTILYADLMIDDPCGEPNILVQKNSPLPAEGLLENFMQLRNPAYLYVDVLWGLNTKECGLKRLRRLRQPLPRGKITPMGTKISVSYKIDVHQAMDIQLIVHDPNGEYTVPLLKLIKNVDLSRGDSEDV